MSSPADMSVPEWRNQSSAKTVDSTPSNRKSDRLYSISAKKAAVSHVGVKMFYNKRSWQVTSPPPFQVCVTLKCKLVYVLYFMFVLGAKDQ